jgi:two-component system response regulator DevR
MALRILIVDDHELVRRGVRALVDRQPAMTVVGEAGTVQEAVRQAGQLAPDVVVLDLRLPDGTGVDACRQIKAALPQTQVVVLTSYPDPDDLQAARDAGADACLLKRVGSGPLLEALQRAGRGERTGAPRLERAPRMRDPTGAFAGLNGQELQILARVMRGRTNQQIGEDLGLSERAVHNRVGDLLTRLGLDSRAQAAAYAARHGIEDYL